METGEFIKKVRVRAGLPDNIEAGEAIDAVFDALRARISHEAGDNIAAQLPRNIKLMWESGFMEHMARSVGGFERMDLNEFLKKIQNSAHLPNRQLAEDVTHAVFATMREQITHGADKIVQSQLPPDIREFWMSSNPPKPVKEESLPTSTTIMGDKERTVSDIEPAQSITEPPGRYDSRKIGPSAASIYRSDKQIENEIMQLLGSSDEIDADGINLEVHAGKVILHGTVKSAEERYLALRIASEALGTTEVDNELIILEVR